MDLKQKTALAVGGTVLAVGAGVGFASLASADPAAPAPQATTSTTPGAGGGPDRMGGGHGHGDRFGADAATLAQKLGLTEDQVRAALQKVRDANKQTTRPTAPPTQAERDAMRAEFIKALAAELKVSEDKLTAALDEVQAAHQADQKAALKTRLDQAVKDGKLTQAEADAVMKAAEAGVIGFGGRR